MEPRLLDCEGLPTGPFEPTRPLYLRIGRWNPADERSRNFARGTIESGVSVYDIDEAGKVVIPEEGEWAEVDLRERLASTDPRWFVQGDLVGEGHDGEPLLHHVRIVLPQPHPLP